VYDPEGVHDFDFSKSFSVYPNPTHNNVTINNTSSIAKSTLQLLDATGRLVKSETIYFVQGKSEINLDELTKGNYMLQILDDKQQVIFSTQLAKN